MLRFALSLLIFVAYVSAATVENKEARDKRGLDLGSIIRALLQNSADLSNSKAKAPPKPTKAALTATNTTTTTTTTPAPTQALLMPVLPAGPYFYNPFIKQNPFAGQAGFGFGTGGGNIVQIAAPNNGYIDFDYQTGEVVNVKQPPTPSAAPSTTNQSPTAPPTPTSAPQSPQQAPQQAPQQPQRNVKIIYQYVPVQPFKVHAANQAAPAQAALVAPNPQYFANAPINYDYYDQINGGGGGDVGVNQPHQPAEGQSINYENLYRSLAIHQQQLNNQQQLLQYHQSASTPAPLTSNANSDSIKIQLQTPFTAIRQQPQLQIQTQQTQKAPQQQQQQKQPESLPEINENLVYQYAQPADIYINRGNDEAKAAVVTTPTPAYHAHESPSFKIRYVPISSTLKSTADVVDDTNSNHYKYIYDHNELTSSSTPRLQAPYKYEEANALAQQSHHYEHLKAKEPTYIYVDAADTNDESKPASSSTPYTQQSYKYEEKYEEAAAPKYQPSSTPHSHQQHSYNYEEDSTQHTQAYQTHYYKESSETYAAPKSTPASATQAQQSYSYEGRPSSEPHQAYAYENSQATNDEPKSAHSPISFHHHLHKYEEKTLAGPEQSYEYEESDKSKAVHKPTESSEVKAHQSYDYEDVAIHFRAPESASQTTHSQAYHSHDNVIAKAAYNKGKSAPISVQHVDLKSTPTSSPANPSQKSYFYEKAAVAFEDGAKPEKSSKPCPQESYNYKEAAVPKVADNSATASKPHHHQSYIYKEPAHPKASTSQHRSSKYHSSYVSYHSPSLKTSYGYTNGHP